LLNSSTVLVLVFVLWQSNARWLHPRIPEQPGESLFQLARFFSVLAGEMRSVAVGWQVYEIMNRPLDLATLVVTGLWAWYFPELQRTNKLDSSAA
jgi:hypothetical protein